MCLGHLNAELVGFQSKFFQTVRGKQIINNFLRRIFTKLKDFFWFYKFLVNLLVSPKIGVLFCMSRCIFHRIVEGFCSY